MTEYNSLFSDKYLKEKLCLSDFVVPNIESKLTAVKGWVREVETKDIYTKKEEQMQSDFLNDIFGKVLEYAYERGLDEYNLEKEEKSKTDGTKPDVDNIQEYPVALVSYIELTSNLLQRTTSSSFDDSADMTTYKITALHSAYPVLVKFVY